jgi:sugar O-acyltransferase (sialic acid O-acetyltransferase NeuD family)
VQGRRKLYIVGAGDFGREMESLLEMTPRTQRDWDIAGYLDDNPQALGKSKSDYQVLGAIGDHPLTKDDRALLTITDSEARERIYHKLKGQVSFLTYVHPSVVVFKYSSIGQGSIVVSNCVISNEVTIGDFVIINQGTQIGHDSVVGDFCSLMSSVDLGGHCELSEKVFVGTGATLIPGIRVGAAAKVGSGSVVIRHVKPGTTVFGNPARSIS